MTKSSFNHLRMGIPDAVRDGMQSSVSARAVSSNVQLHVWAYPHHGFPIWVMRVRV